MAYSFLWLEYKNNILAIFTLVWYGLFIPQELKTILYIQKPPSRIWVGQGVFLEESQMKTSVVLYTNNTKVYLKEKERKNNIHY